MNRRDMIKAAGAAVAGLLGGTSMVAANDSALHKKYWLVTCKYKFLGGTPGVTVNRYESRCERHSWLMDNLTSINRKSVVDGAWQRVGTECVQIDEYELPAQWIEGYATGFEPIGR